MRTRVTTFIGGAFVGLALLTATAGPLSAQEPDAMAEGTPMAEQGGMMQGTTSETGDTEMAGKMDQMMDECLAMMKMMNSMMGGDMSGMMGGEGMDGMEGMEEMPEVAATPGA